MSKENSVGDHKRLLLIDDDPNLILLVKDYLEFRGYEVITAENGQEALEVLQRETPDLIVIQLWMSPVPEPMRKPPLPAQTLTGDCRVDDLLATITAAVRSRSNPKPAARPRLCL